MDPADKKAILYKRLMSIRNLLKRRNLLCPIRYLLNVFGGKWKLPIICILSDGTALRYSSIKKKIG